MDVIMPQLGETVAEGVVTKWYKKVGDSVKADETLFDVETDKVSTEIPAPVSGVIAEILVEEGVTAKVGVRLAVIREKVAVERAPSPRQAAPATAAVATAARAMSVPPAAPGARLSPVVRRLIAEHGLNPAEIRGTGNDGRITRNDVTGFRKSCDRVTGAVAVRTQPPATYDIPGQTRKPLNPVRKRTGEHMLRSWTTAPHVLQAMEADFLGIEQARQFAGAAWKAREGFTLSYLPFVASAVADALAKFPMLNASLDGDDLVLHARINIGIAVDLDFNGLVVPVVKDVPHKSLSEIAREINGLAQRARANQLKPDDVTGGTYTLSNSGGYGTLITAPIINQPQVAILSTDGVHKKPVVIAGPDGDIIAIRPIGVLAQSFDHRAVDGAYSAAFLRDLKTAIETRDWMQALSA